MKRTTVALVCGVAVTVLAGPMPARAEPRTLPVAGADLVSVRLESDGLVLNARDAGQIRAGHPGTDPSHVTLDAGDGFTGAAPARDEFSFLGPPGTPVWVLATDGDFPAFDATAIPNGRLVDDTLTVHLVGVEGPGRFHAYAQRGLGAVDVLLGSAAAEPTTTVLRAGQRRGGVLWAFDTPGSYRVALAVTGRDRGGRELRDEATFRVEVPPISPVETVDPPATQPSPAALRRAAETEHTPLAVPQVAAPKAAAPAPKAAPAGGRKVIADGHVDMGPQLNGSSWTIRLRDDTASPAVWRNLSDVVLHVVDKAKIKVPAGSDYAFLGQAGSDVWMLPQAQQAGIVWPGWNTQDPSVVNGTKGSVTWRLASVSGPGQFKLFLTGSFGRPEVLFDSGKKLPQQLAIAPNTHAHGSWAFTRPGIYHLGVEMAGTTKDGKALVDRRTLNLAVGSVDPNRAFGAPGGNPGTGNDGPGSGGDGGRLAQTGTSWTIAAVLVGGGSVVLGGLVVLGTRRRRAAER
ncbi:TIGR03773 family transporter-associated surface protein [Asanoa sp. WMMD1127]|uniref:TIGR03773 family transporter-associated surface protein n=1 Tax=Asanoa sp. WMMD1127 TaxID=3016107 RepID=UPI002417C55F|nr:TIGR03773 family transporter-associated surface protein [Asanoa sp. WMMD1127]MDG4820506.1 TIGR03773 family transporter-associated surface protein [Asanoa sp. WMMD1127]